jgi:hypothetical protein
MLQAKEHKQESTPIVRICFTVLMLAIAAGFGLDASRSVFAQDPGQKTFNTPGDAAEALATAARNNDAQEMLAILGSSGEDLSSSGDKVADKVSRQRFATKYHEMHRFAALGDGRMILYVGAENWPTPIPLLKKGSKWYFDTASAKQEVLYRRIGANELAVIEVCHAIVDAELDYYSTLHDGDSVHQYAQKLRSTSGKHDGLYWKVNPGELESPIGPLLAEASAEGYRHHAIENRQHEPSPYQGYVYRLLNRQGADAPGGAKSYIVDGKMTGGFGLVAYPVSYKDSGVMTFMVNHDGQIYQKDLGPQTEQIASGTTEYNPDKTWHLVDESQGASAER